MEYQKHYQLFRKFFGINVKFHCNEQNLSISDLASISGLSKQFIELVIKGKANIDFDDFLRIACGFKIQPFMLLKNIYVDDKNDKIKILSVFDINPVPSIKSKEKHKDSKV